MALQILLQTIIPRGIEKSKSSEDCRLEPSRPRAETKNNKTDLGDVPNSVVWYGDTL